MIHHANDPRTAMILLRFATFLCLGGWAWGHLYWEGPYGVLLWQDSTYQIAQWLGISWDEFVGSGAGDGWVQRCNVWIGWFYALAAVLSLTARRTSYVQLAILTTSTLMLGILSYAKYVSAQYQLPMLIEHGGQVLSPLLLTTAIVKGPTHRGTIIIAMIAVVTTFAGHGSYAIGWWPTPGNFFAMTTLTLGLEYESAKTVLRAAGVLDFAVCVLLFVPPLRQIAVGYAAVWGMLTALARPVAGMSMTLIYWGADQYIHETVLRAPHFLIPLFLVFVWRKPNFRVDRNSADQQTPAVVGVVSR
ncbi:hypothetical protein [Roseiconus lacunae]|uniref:hypothetical protein n=1 Tax=Roseiconus lacunae TaxID=2605694 RepID=UPI0011F26C35